MGRKSTINQSFIAFMESGLENSTAKAENGDERQTDNIALEQLGFQH